jgi:glucosamine--fructose-6-phosphate aminotransferase (isomerizing)
MATAH